MDWLIGQKWECPAKGLSKSVLSLNFTKVEKPTELSTCQIKFSKVKNIGDRPSHYLSQDGEIILEMGTATTPIDCYIEILVQNMLLGETSLCEIQTKSEEPISFEVTLNEISNVKYLFELTVPQMYELAQKYRSNGVQMFKTYPRFAHDYFSRAAKCLISFKPFDVLTEASSGVEGSDMESLLQTLQTNIAACLLQQKRYEDVVYQTNFVDTLTTEDMKKAEKALYRRAQAFYYIKAYDKAKETIEKVVGGIDGKKEFITLYQSVKQMRKQDEEHYKSIVQRMFN